MRTALLIAAKDLRQRLRDRSVLIFAVIAPAGLAAIFSLLLGGVTEFHPRYAVADLDGGPMATILVEDVLGSLVDAGVAELEPASTEAEARAWVEDGQTDAALVVPAGFSDAIAGGAPAEVRIVGTADTGLATLVARSIAQRFDDQPFEQLGVLGARAEEPGGKGFTGIDGHER